MRGPDGAGTTAVVLRDPPPVHRPVPTRDRRVPTWPVIAGLLALGTLVQLARGPGVPLWRGVFGEDGGIFLTQALASHGWTSLLQPYQGYVQFVPRLLAEMVASSPLIAAPVLLAGGAALVVALLSVFVFAASGAVLQTRWARVAVAVAPVVLPAGFETNANITDLHWYFDYACFWALAAPLPPRRMAVAGALVAALAMLSDPLAGLFLPLALWRIAEVALGRRSRRGFSFPPAPPAALAAPTAFLIAGVVQVLFGLTQQQPNHFLASHPEDVVGIYGLRVAGSLLLGDRLLPFLYRNLGLPFAFGCLVIVAIAFAWAVRRSPAARPLVLLAGAYSVLWLVVPLLLRGTEGFLDRESADLSGSRYMVNPILLLTVCCLAWLDVQPEREEVAAGAGRLRPAALRSPKAIASLVGGTVVAISFTIPAQRAHGPVWSDSLTAASRLCGQTGQSVAPPGRSAEAPWGLPAGPGDALVPVAPGGPVPPWSVVVPCRRLS